MGPTYAGLSLQNTGPGNYLSSARLMPPGGGVAEAPLDEHPADQERAAGNYDWLVQSKS